MINSLFKVIDTIISEGNIGMPNVEISDIEDLEHEVDYIFEYVAGKDETTSIKIILFGKINDAIEKKSQSTEDFLQAYNKHLGLKYYILNKK